MGASFKHHKQTVYDDFDPIDDNLELTGSDDLFDEEPAASPPLRAPRHRGKAGKHPRGSGNSMRAAALRDDTDDLDDADHAWVARDGCRDRKRVEVSEPFKCRNCRAFIGEPPSGGRNRNHCPLCLYSLHVDAKTPGDRASGCRSSMEPIGTFYRPNLEQVVIHRCLGCGFVRYNRVAADDSPLALSRLPVLDQREVAAIAAIDAMER